MSRVRHAGIGGGPQPYDLGVTDVIVVLVLISGFFVAVAVQRRRKAERRARATTVELVIDGDQVRRRLGDGREESARWAEVISVEVVCTPVRTADGATAFVLMIGRGRITLRTELPDASPGTVKPHLRVFEAAVREAQPHFTAAGIVIGNVDVLDAPGIGRIAAAPALELAIDAAVRPANVHRLALRMK